MSSLSPLNQLGCSTTLYFLRLALALTALSLRHPTLTLRNIIRHPKASQIRYRDRTQPQQKEPKTSRGDRKTPNEMAAAKTAIARQDPPKAARQTNTAEKPKTVISTTAMFKKPAKPSTTRPKTASSAKQTRAPAPSILKRSDRMPQRTRDHPLSVAFTDSSTQYRSALLTSATASLKDVRKALLHRLDRATDAPRVAAHAEHEELTKQLTLPLDTETLATEVQARSSGSVARAPKPPQTTTTTLGKLMDDFRRVVAREAQNLSSLEKEHRDVVAQLVQLAGAPQAMSESSVRERIRELEEEIETDGREAVSRIEREEAEAERGRKETGRQILRILQAQL